MGRPASTSRGARSSAQRSGAGVRRRSGASGSLRLDHWLEAGDARPSQASGSDGSPPRQTSKCRCGPVARPVRPTSPSGPPGLDRVARRAEQGGEVAVAGREAALVADLDHEPVAAHPAGADHEALRRGADDAPRIGGEVDAEVHPAAAVERVRAHAVDARDPRLLHGPAEPRRRARGRTGPGRARAPSRSRAASRAGPRGRRARRGPAARAP